MRRAIGRNRGGRLRPDRDPGAGSGSIDVGFTSAQLEKAGIGATSSLGLDADTDISSGDPDKTARGQERLEQAITMARDIGATHVCGILHSAFQKYAIPTTADGVARAVEVLQRVAETAAKSNITLGLEVVNRYESNVLNTASQAVEMCKRIGGRERQSSPRRLSHEHRGIRYRLGDHRDRRLSRLFPHWRFTSRLHGLRVDRPCRRIPCAGEGRLPGADHLRVVLVARRWPAA